MKKCNLWFWSLWDICLTLIMLPCRRASYDAVCVQYEDIVASAVHVLYFETSSLQQRVFSCKKQLCSEQNSCLYQLRTTQDPVSVRVLQTSSKLHLQYVVTRTLLRQSSVTKAWFRQATHGYCTVPYQCTAPNHFYQIVCLYLSACVVVFMDAVPKVWRMNRTRRWRKYATLKQSWEMRKQIYNLVWSCLSLRHGLNVVSSMEETVHDLKCWLVLWSIPCWGWQGLSSFRVQLPVPEHYSLAPSLGHKSSEETSIHFALQMFRN